MTDWVTTGYRITWTTRPNIFASAERHEATVPDASEVLKVTAKIRRERTAGRPARDIEVVAIQERTEVREIPCGLALRWPGTTT